VLDKAEYSAFESTLNSLSYRIETIQTQNVAEYKRLKGVAQHVIKDKTVTVVQ